LSHLPESVNHGGGPPEIKQRRSSEMSKLRRVVIRTVLMVVPVLYVAFETAGVGHP
jgi:hypothetical protein